MRDELRPFGALSSLFSPYIPLSPYRQFGEAPPDPKALDEPPLVVPFTPISEIEKAVARCLAGIDFEETAVSSDEPSTRAELLRRLGRNDDAREAYRRAIALTVSEPERRMLTRRLADLWPAGRTERTAAQRRRETG